MSDMGGIDEAKGKATDVNRIIRRCHACRQGPGQVPCCISEHRGGGRLNAGWLQCSTSGAQCFVFGGTPLEVRGHWCQSGKTELCGPERNVCPLLNSAPLASTPLLAPAQASHAECCQKCTVRRVGASGRRTRRQGPMRRGCTTCRTRCRTATTPHDTVRHRTTRYDTVRHGTTPYDTHKHIHM